MNDDEPLVGRLPRAYARAVTALRWLLLAGWIAAAAACTIYLPALPTSGYNLGSLIPAHSEAASTEMRLLNDFAFPMSSDTLVVIRNSGGLSPLTQLDALLYALTYDQKVPDLPRPFPDDRILGAVPVFNTAKLFPSSKESGTTVATYLFFSPSTSLNDIRRLADHYADHFRGEDGTAVRITGSFPARAVQSDLVLSHLQVVEIGTLVFAALVVALTFRSLIAPLITLGAAFLSYLVSTRILGELAQNGSVQLPPPLEPLVVALVLGVLTDYSVFFFTEARDRMLAGGHARDSLRLSLRHNIPIIAVAGLTVTVGTASLYVSRLQLFREFGPGLAISVGVGALSAMTFVPAMMAILGRRIYWPSRPARAGRDRPDEQVARAGVLVRVISTRPGAVVAVCVCLGALGAAAWPLLHTQLDASFIRSLPADSPAREGSDMLAQGFARGLVGPAEMLVTADGVRSDLPAVRRLQGLVASQPGVASAFGPATLPALGRWDPFVAKDRPEARLLVFFDADPLSGDGIGALRNLQTQMPRLLDRSGLGDARVAFAGDTAVAATATAETSHNLALVLVAAFAVEFLILAIYLRALLAPLILLAASGLVIASSLGLTTWLFQDHLHSGGLTFYAPFATSVLLIALGSDYNVFAAGRIWEQSRAHRLKRAIRRAMPASSRAITVAGFTLAGSFAIVALIPLLPFREMAFTMVTGLLIDTFVVRSILTPGVLTLVGPAASWPGGRLRNRTLRRRLREPDLRRAGP